MFEIHPLINCSLLVSDKNQNSIAIINNVLNKFITFFEKVPTQTPNTINPPTPRVEIQAITLLTNSTTLILSVIITNQAGKPTVSTVGEELPLLSSNKTDFVVSNILSFLYPAHGDIFVPSSVRTSNEPDERLPKMKHF